MAHGDRPVAFESGSGVYFGVYFEYTSRYTSGADDGTANALCDSAQNNIHRHIYIYIVSQRSTKSCIKPNSRTTRRRSCKQLDTSKCRRRAVGKVEMLSWSSWMGRHTKCIRISQRLTNTG